MVYVTSLSYTLSDKKSMIQYENLLKLGIDGHQE